MSIVVIEAGKNGKIELTKEQLQEMLDKAYAEGASSCERHCWRCYPWQYSNITIPADRITFGDSFTATT